MRSGRRRDGGDYDDGLVSTDAVPSMRAPDTGLNITLSEVDMVKSAKHILQFCN